MADEKLIDNNIPVELLKKNKLFPLFDDRKVIAPTTFEEAIVKTGFGKFNIALMAFAAPGIFTPVFATTTLSYIFAAAQCDLDLSLQDKGVLNAVTYAGMISSAFIWGFLVDTFGRRKLMVYGYFINGIIITINAFSQSMKMLTICIFFEGFIINGPFSAMTAYLSEFHSSRYRSRIQLVNGSLTSCAQIVLPLLAWGILPLPINWTLFNGYIAFHSWNLYIFVTGMCSFISGGIFFFLPESPKFLMTLGDNDKALKVLQTVYSWNTGKPTYAYPVTQLVEEKHKDKNIHRSKLQALNEGIHSFQPLFKYPYLRKFLLICTILLMCISSLNMLRLWTPQLFQIMEDYRTSHNGSTAYLCTMLEDLEIKNDSAVCSSTNVGNSMVYIDAITVAAFSVFCFIITGTIVNFLGKKKVVVLLTAICTSAAISLYFAFGSVSTTILSAIFIGVGNVSNNVVYAVVVDVFPTSIRTFALSLIMSISRAGAFGGNVMFPKLIQQGCAPPFFTLAGMMAVASLLGFFLPNTENKDLK